MNKIDVVIPLGPGSIWQDNEVRYAIRSVCKYFVDLGRVFVVGEKPDFLNWSNSRLVHVDQRDVHGDDKDLNLIIKVLKACYSGVSDQFVRMSDDQCFLQPVLVKDLVPYYLYDLKTRTDYNNRWSKRLENTKKMLLAENKSTFNYESHFPMVYEREKFVSVMNELKNQKATINTWYFNKTLSEHQEIPQGYKYTAESPMYTFDEKILFARFLGYNNKGVREGVLKSVLERFFSEKCFLEV